MAVPVVTYERGNSYVTEPGTGAHALMGSLYVGNTEICDTFERMDGHVHMPPGTYVRSSMYEHATKRKVLNPSLTSASTGNLEYSGKLKAQIAKLEKQRNDTKGPTPLLDKALKDANLLLAKMKQYGEILVHHGTYPSDFEGCIGAGWHDQLSCGWRLGAAIPVKTIGSQPKTQGQAAGRLRAQGRSTCPAPRRQAICQRSALPDAQCLHIGQVSQSKHRAGKTAIGCRPRERTVSLRPELLCIDPCGGGGILPGQPILQSRFRYQPYRQMGARCVRWQKWHIFGHKALY